MAGELRDDGTMDTVIACSECGEEARFNFSAGPGEEGDVDYDTFVQECIEEFDNEHECPEADDDE